MKIMKITLYPPKLYGNTLYSYTYPLELIFIWKLSWTEKVKTQVIFFGPTYLPNKQWSAKYYPCIDFGGR